MFYSNVPPREFLTVSVNCVVHECSEIKYFPIVFFLNVLNDTLYFIPKLKAKFSGACRV